MPFPATGSPRSHPGVSLLSLLLALGVLAWSSQPVARAGAVVPAAGTTTTGGAAVPQGFVGVDVDGPLLDSGTGVDLAQQLRSMVSSGVESVRVAFDWAAAQPYQSWSQVPADDESQFTDVDGSPIDFQSTDTFVGDAARDGISLLPIVLYAPAWDARTNPDGFATPLRDGPYAAYLTALIGRYGPHGSFWGENPQIPKLPIRGWQIWNEPNISIYWPQPFAAGYVSLLRAAHAAIKRADPGAEVVLGALTNYAWTSIGSIYRIPGARALFDVVAVNGFTKLPADVILYLRFMRQAMRRFNDGHKPLLATEVSWPSAQGKVNSGYDFDTTEVGQARNIAELLPLIGRDRTSLGLAGFYWYTWMGDESEPTNPFDYAGLLAFDNGQVSPKPALSAFRTAALALEQCKAKGTVATSCIR
ncbi:MAG: hypothetical protein ACLP50_16430 [Solirubrobacteraceae bacterium]